MGLLDISLTAMKVDVRKPNDAHGMPSLSYTSGPRCNRGDGGGVGLSACLCLHAEENALLEAGRERIREGAILYCDT
jgi:deoxycytidylate deaminase